MLSVDDLFFCIRECEIGRAEFLSGRYYIAVNDHSSGWHTGAIDHVCIGDDSSRVAWFSIECKRLGCTCTKLGKFFVRIPKEEIDKRLEDFIQSHTNGEL